jgi:hypothetical protein
VDRKGDTNLLHVADIVPLCLSTLLIKVLEFSHQKQNLIFLFITSPLVTQDWK